MAKLDVVVVSYNSREHLRGCVMPLSGLEDIDVIVVDNASSDGSLETVADLPVEVIARESNGGFSVGCNAGWRSGSAPFVLFLNPDAVIEADAARKLVAVAAGDAAVAAVAPRIVDHDGGLLFSQRRFPRLSSTYAQALFLHRLFPQASWSDEVVRDREAYERAGSPEWASGACLLVKRSALEQVDGFDEGFFLYCEDKDLCRRLRAAGLDIRFEPSAVVRHVGGASAPHATVIPLLAASRARYARKHCSAVPAAGEGIGIALGELTHALGGRGDRSVRAAHGRSFLSTAAGVVSKSAPSARR